MGISLLTRMTLLAEISFPLGLEGTAGLPLTLKGLGNCWNADGKIIQRPGLTLRGTNSRVARGPFEWNGSLYNVASQELIKYTNVLTGAFSVIGTIEGTANVVISNDFNNATIVSKGGNLYTLSKTDVLTDISANANIVPSNSIANLNGRTIYIPSDGSPAFFSDVNASGTVQALSFFDAEQLPDNNTEVFQLNNILYISGTDSTQSFLDRGLDPVPYVPQTGRIDNGVIGGSIEIQGTVLFIGREKGQDLGIYALGGGVSPKISNEFIDTLLSTYTEAELAQAVANRYKYRGYDIVTFSLARDAFGFYKGNWHRLDTMINGVNVPWQVGFIQEFELNYYSFFSGNFNILDSVNNDAGEPFIREILGGIEADRSFTAQSLQYHVSQGFNENLGSVTLEMSDDNVLFYPPVQRNTGTLGNYQWELEWNYPGGLGLYNRFMGYRISTGEDIDFSGTRMFIET
jgi:hypothetical protein